MDEATRNVHGAVELRDVYPMGAVAYLEALHGNIHVPLYPNYRVPQGVDGSVLPAVGGLQGERLVYGDVLIVFPGCSMTVSPPRALLALMAA